VLPSSCSIGALCSLGSGAEAEVEVVAAVMGAVAAEEGAVAAEEGAAAAEEGAAAAEEGAAVVEETADGVSPFKKGTENICSGVNPAMLAPRSGFDAGRMRMNASA
jgi:hypothetical protein